MSNIDVSNAVTTEPKVRARRGFAVWPREKFLAACSAGGKTSHARKTGHEWTRETAKLASDKAAKARTEKAAVSP